MGCAEEALAGVEEVEAAGGVQCEFLGELVEDNEDWQFAGIDELAEGFQGGVDF
jgi:stress response protein SCP2